ncbi:MAG: hypothetical protein ACR2OG_01125, partial [Gemmatimonadaceae bacterium]
VARLLRTVLRTTPKDATHWSVRGIADKTGISKSTVQRYFALFADTSICVLRSKPLRTPSVSIT